jgi:hypothetical protein
MQGSFGRDVLLLSKQYTRARCRRLVIGVIYTSQHIRSCCSPCWPTHDQHTELNARGGLLCIAAPCSPGIVHALSVRPVLSWGI